MRLTASQYAVRFAWGVGLLFVPAVQEKLCAIAPPEPSEQPVCVNLPQSSGQDEPDKERPPLTLAALAPDVVAPRRADHWRIASDARMRPLPAATSPDRDRSDSRTTVVVDSTSSPFAVSPPRLPESDAAPLAAVADHNVLTSHVFESCIRETGPPTAPRFT